MNLRGLFIKCGSTTWEWLNYREVPSVIRRQTERLERWSCQCSSCGNEIVKLARLPQEVMTAYVKGRNYGNVVVTRPAGTMEALEQTSCRRCERAEEVEAA
jgi:hypothetical protein